jgi:hypothetical protein
MEQIPLGKAPARDAGRDAVHIAILPVVAYEPLNPGDHVSIVPDYTVGGTSDSPAVRRGGKTIGIIDPFKKGLVPTHNLCWLLLYPNTITSLRHHWTHPDLPAELSASVEDSEKWLREYAAKINYYDDPDTAYIRLLHGLRNREITSYGSTIQSLDDLPSPNELKYHAEKVLGERIDWGDYRFYCSC